MFKIRPPFELQDVVGPSSSPEGFCPWGVELSGSGSVPLLLFCLAVEDSKVLFRSRGAFWGHPNHI